MAKHSRQTTRLHAGLAAAITALVVATGAALFGGSPNPVPVADPGTLSVQQECQQALTYPSRSNADKTWLRQCVHALATPPVPSPTVAPTPTASPTQSPTPAPTTPSATPTAAPTPTPTPPPAGCTGQANPACTGVPAGWVPTTTRSGTWRITAPGTYSDVLVNGDIIVNALGVVLERVRVTGGGIVNADGIRCYNGTKLRQVEVIQSVPRTNAGANGVIGPGGYDADRVKIEDRVEGFRVGAHGDQGCQTTTITNSFVHITPPQPCGDWHGDGIQVYDGPPLVARNVTLWLDEVGGCGGTAPYFQAGAEFGNAPPDIDGMLVRGGGFSFRLLMAGSVQHLHVVDGSWFYGPVDVICSQLTAWSADVVRVDANWQTTSVVRTLPC